MSKVALVPPAAIVTLAGTPATALLGRARVALVPRAAIVTLAGTLAAAWLLEGATCAPRAGAGRSITTVPVTGLPPVTLPWLRLSAATPGGTTVSEPVSVAPP